VRRRLIIGQRERPADVLLTWKESYSRITHHAQANVHGAWTSHGIVVRAISASNGKGEP
jgi:hypothetical protein